MIKRLGLEYASSHDCGNGNDEEVPEQERRQAKSNPFVPEEVSWHSVGCCGKKRYGKLGLRTLYHRTTLESGNGEHYKNFVRTCPHYTDLEVDAMSLPVDSYGYMALQQTGPSAPQKHQFAPSSLAIRRNATIKRPTITIRTTHTETNNPLQSPSFVSVLTGKSSLIMSQATETDHANLRHAPAITTDSFRPTVLHLVVQRTNSAIVQSRGLRTLNEHCNCSIRE